MELGNKTRFWTGIGMGAVEVVGFGIFGLACLNWNWLTLKVGMLILGVSLIVLYNALAFILIWNGSKKKK